MWVPPYQTASYRSGSFETRNSTFLRNELNKGINQRNFIWPLKVPWVNTFIKLRCYLAKGFEWGDPPLTKPRPIGMGRTKREIPNFDGMILTRALNKEILRTP